MILMANKNYYGERELLCAGFSNASYLKYTFMWILCSIWLQFFMRIERNIWTYFDATLQATLATYPPSSANIVTIPI